MAWTGPSRQRGFMARRDEEHPPYWECPDMDCPRFPCKVCKEGYVRGYAEGYAAGAAAAARAGS